MANDTRVPLYIPIASWPLPSLLLVIAIASRLAAGGGVRVCACAWKEALVLPWWFEGHCHTRGIDDKRITTIASAYVMHHYHIRYVYNIRYRDEG